MTLNGFLFSKHFWIQATVKLHAHIFYEYEIICIQICLIVTFLFEINKSLYVIMTVISNIIKQTVINLLKDYRRFY